ncbi:MAG TPA: Crp/Fnr family transcriptional regulator [Pyrinomonadaceae bacterium]|jgi:CRP-like cAMP-binding protein|nr:Crp/Fnr family transcriptional regulator [Pyrinomonadaceae bacterium]
MSTYAKTLTLSENQILAGIPVEEYERLRPIMEDVQLHLGDVIARPDEPIEYVYFPHRSVFSVIAMMEDGSEVEIGVIGNEGMFGLQIILGTKSTPLQTIVQIADGATRIKASLFRDQLDHQGQLYRSLLTYMQAFFIQTAQTAACHRRHRLDERLARWLLMCHDRCKSDDLVLTHEFLAVMLGVRRAGISEAASKLQAEGFIKYSRGHIHIFDRRGLEAVSCECYGVVKREFDRLLLA